MTSASKNVYINKLDNIVDEYNNTYRRTIKMKPLDVKDDTYIDFKKEVNDKDRKFKVGDNVIISKYKKFFDEEVFVVSKIANTVPCIYLINDVNGEGIIGTFYEK